MIKRLLLALTIVFITPNVFSQLLGTEETPTQKIIEEKMRFPEGTVVYRNQILVSNFGTSELNPLNNEGRGYILSVSMNGKVKTLIPADGSLSAPKGMTVVGKHLFIADVGRIVIYDLNNIGTSPQIIAFPAEDTFVNDLVAIDDMIFASVTNTGRIYAINVKNPAILTGSVPRFIGHVPGANGMAVYGTNLYIASYNAEGTPSDENVIYAFDLSKQSNSMSKLIPDLKPGQYDGVAVSEDGSTLYFSSWGDGSEDSTPNIFSYKLDGSAKPRAVDFSIDFKGPADISIRRGYIWIPDLPASKLYRLPL